MRRYELPPLTGGYVERIQDRNIVTVQFFSVVIPAYPVKTAISLSILSCHPLIGDGVFLLEVNVSTPQGFCKAAP